MNLYLISQDEKEGYETFDSAVVCAESSEDAASIHPSGNDGDWGKSYESGKWCSAPERVQAKLIGVAAPSVNRGVILSSYNAG